MLPCFVPRRLACDILNAGKALNFIRLCCGDASFSVSDAPALAGTVSTMGATRVPTAGSHADEAKAGPRSLSAASLARLEYGREAELSTVVRRSSAIANSHLLSLLMSRFELRAHCAHLQQFVLLGKGDFVQSLMEHLAPQLAKPATQLHRHHLLTLVELAVRSSATTALPDGGSSGGSVGVSSSSDVEPHALLLRHLDVSLTKAPGERYTKRIIHFTRNVTTGILPSMPVALCSVLSRPSLRPSPSVMPPPPARRIQCN